MKKWVKNKDLIENALSEGLRKGFVPVEEIHHLGRGAGATIIFKKGTN